MLLTAHKHHVWNFSLLFFALSITKTLDYVDVASPKTLTAGKPLCYKEINQTNQILFLASPLDIFPSWNLGGVSYIFRNITIPFKRDAKTER